MSSTKQVRDTLPFTVQAYGFTGAEVGMNARKPCPGKAYLDTNEIIVRVYNATISEQAGFCGEIVAIGDYVDTFSIGDYVFGGKQRPALQAYIVVKSEDIAVLPANMSPAAAARLYAATAIYPPLQALEMGQRVVVLGDMTGFAVQMAIHKKCIVTSSERLDIGESAVIESDNFLDYLTQQPDPFDVVVDATGDLDLYNYCDQFTTRSAEYISINPVNPVQAAKAQLLPAILGGGTRKLTVSKLAAGQKKAALLNTLAAQVQKGELMVLDQRIVSFEAVLQVYPAIREVTVVNVIKQSDLTPPEPEEVASTKPKGKAKAVAPSPKPKRSPVQARRAPATIAEQANSPNKNYSPRRPSRLQESILASQGSESSPEMRDAEYMAGEQHRTLQGLQETGEEQQEISEADLMEHATPPQRKATASWPRQATARDEYELSDMRGRPNKLLFDASTHEESLAAPVLSLPSQEEVLARETTVDQDAEDESGFEDVDDGDDEEEVDDNHEDTAEADKAAALREAEEKIAALQRQIEMLSRADGPKKIVVAKPQITTRRVSKERRRSKEQPDARHSNGLLVDVGAAQKSSSQTPKTPSPSSAKHKKKSARRRSSSPEEAAVSAPANPDVLTHNSDDEEEETTLLSS